MRFPNENAETQRRWRANNPGKSYAAVKAYAASHPEKVRQMQHARRARVRGAAGVFRDTEWKALLVSFGNRCLCCGNSTTLTPDHVIPLARGGTNYIENIQPLCRPCNSRKHLATTDYRIPPPKWAKPEQFVKQVGAFLFYDTDGDSPENKGKLG